MGWSVGSKTGRTCRHRLGQVPLTSTCPCESPPLSQGCFVASGSKVGQSALPDVKGIPSQTEQMENWTPWSDPAPFWTYRNSNSAHFVNRKPTSLNFLFISVYAYFLLQYLCHKITFSGGCKYIKNNRDEFGQSAVRRHGEFWLPNYWKPEKLCC